MHSKKPQRRCKGQKKSKILRQLALLMFWASSTHLYSECTPAPRSKARWRLSHPPVTSWLNLEQPEYFWKVIGVCDVTECICLKEVYSLLKVAVYLQLPRALYLNLKQIISKIIQQWHRFNMSFQYFLIVWFCFLSCRSEERDCSFVKLQ